MPDWNGLIRERLGSLNLSAAVQNDVVEELAAHLEDLYEEQIAAGVRPSEAMQVALGEVDSWQPLARDIERSKQESIMNKRTKQLWIPALISLSASMIWMMVLQIIDSRLRMPWKHAGLAYIPYVIWVVTLPLIGTACGYLSMRGGSQKAVRLAAVIFPSIVMSVIWLVLLVVVILRKAPYPFQTLNFIYGFALWVVVPAAALWLGTLPLARINRISAQSRNHLCD
jgi:hypothetical protein